MRIKTLPLLCFFWVTALPAQTVTVGPSGDSDCDFEGVQVAIDSGAAEIRVSNAMDFFDNLVIHDRDLMLKGGYPSCEAAADGFPITGPSVVDGSGATEPVVTITTAGTHRNVLIQNIGLIKGTSNPGAFKPAGGISMPFADVTLHLLSADLFNNDGTLGGGIYVAGANTELIVERTSIRVNDASDHGGGIYCEQGATISIYNNANLSINATRGNGGGIYADDCEVNLYTGNFLGESGPRGINGNDADTHGGGIYASNGSTINLNGYNPMDDFTHGPAGLEGNIADFDNDGTGEGGAIFATGSGTTINAHGVLVEGNRSGLNGGGFYLESQAFLNLGRQAGICWDAFQCNYFFGNRADPNGGHGGAIYLRTGAAAVVTQAYFEGQRADSGTAIYATDTNTNLILSNSMFFNNGNDGADSFSDQYVIASVAGANIDSGFNTLADNHAETAVFRVDNAGLRVISSIVFDPSTGPLRSAAGSNTTAYDCLVTHDSSAPGTNVSIGNPQFINRGAGDLHINGFLSLATDACDDANFTVLFDYDGDRRPYDDPFNPNNVGSWDIGADETVLSDVIYANGFE